MMKIRSLKTRSLFLMTAAAALAVIALAAPEPTIGQDLHPAFSDTDTEPVPLTAEDLSAQDPITPASQDPMDLLAAELASQTIELVNNQTALEARLAEVEEMVRQAKIYAARGGRARKP